MKCVLQVLSSKDITLTTEIPEVVYYSISTNAVTSYFL